MSRVFAFRPEPGLSRTIAAADEMGLAVAGEPLSMIEPLAWKAPLAREFDGLLVGSANVFLHGGEGLARYARLPAYCVGEATATAARAAGFEVAMVGSGGLQGVLDGLTGREIRLLRLSGQERIKLNRTAKVSLTEVAVYAARPLPLPADIAARLPGSIALLHSAATARHLAEECDRLGVARDTVTIAALGNRIAASAGPGWSAIHSAAQPDDAHLLALVSQICKNGSGT